MTNQIDIELWKEAVQFLADHCDIGHVCGNDTECAGKVGRDQQASDIDTIGIRCDQRGDNTAWGELPKYPRAHLVEPARNDLVTR